MVAQDEKRFVVEAERTTSVRRGGNVVVCGGGPAGIAAALAAAREGADVTLIEMHGALGGVWTTGLLSAVLDADKPSGVLAEIGRRLDADRARVARSRTNFLYDAEMMKLAVERMCQEAGVRIRLLTRLVGVVTEDRRVTHVVTESKSGREAWSGTVFVDATGDGDVGALAGCRFDVGHPDDGGTQPASLMAILAHVDAEEVRPFWEGTGHARKDNLLAEFARAGFTPSYGAPTLFHLGEDVFALMANHQYAVPATDADRLTEATLAARQEVDASVRALRSLGGPWSRLRLMQTAAQLGIREGRRIRGRTTLRLDSLLAGEVPDDSVTVAGFAVDVHAVDPAKGTATNGRDSDRPRAQPYGIPFGTLVAADVEGLLLAGRCISGDFFAHASYRVTGNAVATGEAAGYAAAHMARLGESETFSWPVGLRY